MNDGLHGFAASWRTRLRDGAAAARRAGEDVFGSFPTDTDTGDGHRRESRVIRFFAIYATASTMLNVVLGSAILQMLPLEKVDPLLLTTSDRSNQIVKVEPLQRNMQGFEIMTEVLCKEYVELRNTIVQDGKVMSKRFGPNGDMAKRSSPKVYEDFVKEMRNVIAEADKRHITRNVRILADPIKVDDNFYQVEFETIDIENGVETRQAWIASMVVDFLPQKVTLTDRFMNPLGFTVTAYSTVRKVKQ